jgi:hypothetical protein
MLKIIRWDNEDVITHDLLRMQGDIGMLVPQQPWITLLPVTLDTIVAFVTIVAFFILLVALMI